MSKLNFQNHYFSVTWPFRNMKTVCCLIFWKLIQEEQHLFKNEIFCNVTHVLMSPLITLMHPYWKKILTNQHIFEGQCTFSSYYLLQYKHCQSDQQGISSFTSRRRSNFLLLCLLRALSRSSSYLSWYRSLQQLFYRKYCIAHCWHRALEKCTHTFDRLSHIFKVLCVCARVSYEYVRGEFVCVCSRLIEYVRLIWVCARRVPRVSCV